MLHVNPLVNVTRTRSQVYQGLKLYSRSLNHMNLSFRQRIGGCIPQVLRWLANRHSVCFCSSRSAGRIHPTLIFLHIV